MKNFFIIIIAVIIGLFLINVVRDQIIRGIATVAVTKVIGAPVHINNLSLGLMRQTVRLSGFRIYNPKDFPRGILVDMPNIFVDLDAFALLKGKIHVQKIDIQLKEIGLIKNKEGKLNVDSLKISQQQPKKEDKKSGNQLAIQMDLVNLSMGRVVSKNYGPGQKPEIRVYDINIKKTYKNINSVQQLTGLIIAEPLKAAGIQGATIYGASMLTGVAALPVAAAFAFTAKDHAIADFSLGWDKVYNAGLKVLKDAGSVKKEDKAAGVIEAAVYGSDVTLKLKKISYNKTEIMASARKFMLPQIEIAAGIIYQISEELK